MTKGACIEHSRAVANMYFVSRHMRHISDLRLSQWTNPFRRPQGCHSPRIWALGLRCTRHTSLQNALSPNILWVFIVECALSQHFVGIHCRMRSLPTFCGYSLFHNVIVCRVYQFPITYITSSSLHLQ
jgi:hypothetical protein